MRVLISGGRVIDAAHNIDQKIDVAIAAGRIVGLFLPTELPEDFNPDRIIDASGLWVMPGLVDLSVRLKEPGNDCLATLEHELHAALVGGVTSIICPPDSDPILDEPGLIEMLRFKAKQLNLARVYPLGALTPGLKGGEITEMAELSEAGCVGFSQAEQPVFDTRVLFRAMQYAKGFNFTVHLRAEEPYLSREGVAHAGPYASRMGLNGIPVISETISLQRHFELVRATGARLHVCRLSSAKGVEMLRQAKSEGLPVSCDVAIHHLHLIDLDIGYFNSSAYILPPLREQRDRDALRQGLLDGTIDAICSDHVPIDDDLKLLPFGESQPGATGLELLLGLTVKWAHEAHIPLKQVVNWLAKKPAEIAGLQSGTLQPGVSADVLLFNPNIEWIVDQHSLVSRGKHTPFEGLPLQGKVVKTLVAGQVLYESQSD